MSDRTRRDLLRATGTALVGGLAASAGCVAGSDVPGTETNTTDDGATDTTTTDQTTTTERTTTTTERTTTTTERTTRDRTDDTKREHVVIENRSDEEHVVWIEVVRDGETLLSGRYRVPGNTGIEVAEPTFPWDSYAATAGLQGGPSTEREWQPDSCSATPHPDGNQNLGAVIEAEADLSLVVNGCDYLKLGSTYVDEYEPASEYRIESTTEG